MTGKICIIGAGPSGCFLAQALLKSAPGLEVDVIDALPVPFGLVRYGVAADHQGTKAIARQFARIFERQGARFLGNICVGRDITLTQLQAAYDVVVLAAGLSGDRRLGISGDTLSGVYGAGSLTRALNEHPDAPPLPALGPRPLIIGNGNVALDILRLLAKTQAELEGSDLGPGPSQWLAQNRIDHLTIVGRAAPERAKFDTVMLKELAKLSDVTIQMNDIAPSATDADGEKLLQTLTGLDGKSDGPRQLIFRFGLTPLALTGDTHVRAAHFSNAAQQQVDILCSSVITAIGFEAQNDWLPRDALIQSAADQSSGRLAPRLYAAGWFRRGPRGTIPEHRTDAQILARTILADLDPDAGRAGRRALGQIKQVTDFDGWLRIDAAETQSPPTGRCRSKISSRLRMVQIAQQEGTRQ